MKELPYTYIIFNSITHINVVLRVFMYEGRCHVEKTWKPKDTSTLISYLGE